MIAVGLVYLGLIVTLLGGICLLRPLSSIGIRNRRSATYVLGLGLLVAGLGFAFPASETQIAVPKTQLDQFAPVFQFNEIHSIQVMAPRDRTYRAIKAVTPDEIMFFRALTWLRRFGRPGPEGILNPPARLPLLELATRTSFLLLADQPNREIVIGTAVVVPPGFRLKRQPVPNDFKRIREPGFVMAAMNFFIEDGGRGVSVVTTETRVYATDLSTQRQFAAYWRVIYPGSSLIRLMWLRAVKKRAEAAVY